MKKLPCKLFTNCDIPESGDAWFNDIVPGGFSHAVHLYLSDETIADDNAIENATQFFDRAAHWDVFFRKTFLSLNKGCEEFETVKEYFEYYKEEVPDVFGVEDVSDLSLDNFTLGYDQILYVAFDNEYRSIFLGRAN